MPKAIVLARKGRRLTAKDIDRLFGANKGHGFSGGYRPLFSCLATHRGSGFFFQFPDRRTEVEAAHITVDGRERKAPFKRLACGCLRVSFPRGHKNDPSEIRLVKKKRRKAR